MHLDYIPVAYKCDRGQKIQNSMNGALMEQGILNIEVDPEVAEKVYGLRKKPRRRKKNVTLEEVPLSERLKCFEKLEEKPEQTEQTKEGETEGGKITKPRVVTNLQQWTDTQRNRLKKIARSHGFEITEKNEKRDHLTTEDYILSKNPNLNPKATPFYTFADDINFDDARLMASKRDGKGLCEWFTGLEHKFCG